MPAAALTTSPDTPGLQANDLWHLVNYVLSLKETPPTIAQRQ